MPADAGIHRKGNMDFRFRGNDDRKASPGSGSTLMSDVTIKQLAKVLGTPIDKLLAQLAEAGM